MQFVVVVADGSINCGGCGGYGSGYSSVYGGSSSSIVVV